MRWSRFLVANAAGGVLWSDTYAFGAYALGNAASSIGSTITIVGLAVADVLLNAPTRSHHVAGVGQVEIDHQI